VRCRGCGDEDGAPAGSHPRSSRCGKCPPQICPDCGQMDSWTAKCSCWIEIDGLPLADIKGLLALGDLSVGCP
jgi:hypothetical protein